MLFTQISNNKNNLYDNSVKPIATIDISPIETEKINKQFQDACTVYDSEDIASQAIASTIYINE